MALRSVDREEAQRVVGTLPQTRGTAVVALRLFVDRWKVIDGDARRGKKSARLLADALVQRGLSTETRADAERLLARAMEDTPGKPTARARDMTEAERAALGELHGWVQDWSALARQAITRRDWLIRLGIGKRRQRVQSNV
jgi:hypothetical protein